MFRKVPIIIPVTMLIKALMRLSAASYADRVMFIKDGEVFHQIYRGDMTRSAMLDKICDAVTVLMRGGEDSES